MPVVNELVTRRAQRALGQLLEERPEFKDNKSNSIQDLIPFLEIEEGSQDWLPDFEGNTRALSLIWQSVIKNGPPKTNPSEEARPAVPPVEIKTKLRQSPRTIRKSPENNRENSSQTPVENNLPLEGEVISPEEFNLMVSGKNSSPQVPDERAIQTSRALAEQFTIVQYYEQMLEQTQQQVEEMTGALARAKKDQLNAAQAYANSLEDLARLMASSLGPKASEFSKLFSRVIGNPNSKK